MMTYDTIIERTLKIANQEIDRLKGEVTRWRKELTAELVKVHKLREACNLALNCIEPEGYPASYRAIQEALADTETDAPRR